MVQHHRHQYKRALSVTWVDSNLQFNIWSSSIFQYLFVKFVKSKYERKRRYIIWFLVFFRNLFYLPETSHLTNLTITRTHGSSEGWILGVNLQKGTWRVRAALVYKNLSYEEVSINIVEKDQSWINYQKNINPMGFVPAGFVSYNPPLMLTV